MDGMDRPLRSLMDDEVPPPFFEDDPEEKKHYNDNDGSPDLGQNSEGLFIQ